ncbi:hypothetical protein HAX54_025474 [Datura stramonium]|uniref:Uncharacterized protein n=1 Tax=Datura stramonium TaxID=4076 RepID=A0ABS8UZK3_DATST|nr:hypothetical protein [Datura stramonium]
MFVPVEVSSLSDSDNSSLLHDHQSAELIEDYTDSDANFMDGHSPYSLDLVEVSTQEPVIEEPLVEVPVNNVYVLQQPLIEVLVIVEVPADL